MMERHYSASQNVGKPEWRDMLGYIARLREKSVRRDDYFPYPWEEIGPGYCYGPGFGHWDIVHAVMDVMEAEPEHAKRQLLNNLSHQQEDGLVPGCIYLRNGKFTHSAVFGHPPVWVMAAQRYYDLTGDTDFLRLCHGAATRQANWFRANRRAREGGYFYLDILTRQWESGVDEGVRFDDAPKTESVCVDAASHMYLLCDAVSRWSEILGTDDGGCRAERDELGGFIRNRLYDPETGWFYDIWKRDDPKRFPECFEGCWPMIVGAATEEQARAVAGHLMNPEEFFAEHPVRTVSKKSPAYEMRMWRGPAWNSMTYWVIQGFLRWNFTNEARVLAEAVLDASAKTFAETGNIWEFYDPSGANPIHVARKPDRSDAPNHPCTDYLGHNPLIDLARLWEDLR